MKKSVKGIIGLTAVLVVLGGGYTALVLTDPDKENPDSSISSESSESEQRNIVLIHDDNVSEDEQNSVIKTVDVKNTDGELHVVQKTPATSETSATYTLDGFQDIAMKTSIIGTLANNANGLTSVDLIEENCTNPEKFGLDSPEITVDVEYETGTKYTLFIGNEAPSGAVTYVMLDNSNTVYTVNNSTIANYSKKVMELVDTTILESPDEMPIVESLRIERDDLDYDIFLEYDDNDDDSKFHAGTSAAHLMKEPVEAYLSVEDSNYITTGMFGLYASEVYSVHCTDDDIAEAGLKEPFCTVTMKCNDKNEYKLLLSEPFNDSENGKCCYAMLEDGNIIFTVSVDKAKWVTVKPVDIASTMYLASYVWSISDMKVTAGNDEYNFEISQINPDEELESPTSADFAVKLNGQDFDSERYRLFYSFLIKGNAEDFAFEEKLPSKEPMVTIEYTDSYEKRKIKFDFYDYSNMTAIIAVDGESRFFIAKSFVETIIENTKKFATDEDFATTWK
ncbi:MAG: DUF4340 domain-containing protein [Ruminococcus sp.]|nr:DUF4340 domain-containing protein [Ruminococcus sp.]